MRRKNNPKDQELEELREAVDDAIDSLRKNRSIEAFERLQEVAEPETDGESGDGQN